MLATELIKELQGYISCYGNKDVVIEYTEGNYRIRMPIDDVTYFGGCFSIECNNEKEIQ